MQVATGTSVVLLSVQVTVAHPGAEGPDGTHDVAAVDATHRRLLTLDSHLDSTIHFARKGWSFGDRHDPSTEIAQLDVPRMADGNTRFKHQAAVDAAITEWTSKRTKHEVTRVIAGAGIAGCGSF